MTAQRRERTTGGNGYVGKAESHDETKPRQAIDNNERESVAMDQRREAVDDTQSQRDEIGNKKRSDAVR